MQIDKLVEKNVKIRDVKGRDDALISLNREYMKFIGFDVGDKTDVEYTEINGIGVITIIKHKDEVK